MDCSVDGCVDPGYCKGYCRIHYSRWHKHGDPLHVGKRGPARRYCDIPGCDKPRAANGLCDMHRKRLERHGDPLALMRIRGEGTEPRWWFYVDRHGDGECWPWTGHLDTNGYGVLWSSEEGRLVKAHRWGYERFVEPIPDGLMPDHTCHDPEFCRLGSECPHRRCVNYRHLEPVTNRENTLRGASTRLADDDAAALLVRWRRGIGIDTLAAEIGMDRSALHRRLVRLETAPPG